MYFHKIIDKSVKRIETVFKKKHKIKQKNEL